MDLTGKNVCFVACFGGIGFETCKVLMTKKLKTLILLDQMFNEEAMNELKELDSKCSVLFYRFDVTKDSKKLTTIIDDVGVIDVFVYGAGICNDHEIELTVQINFVGLMKALSMVFPHMDKSRGGKGGMIASIASVVGLDVLAAMPVYSATKSAMISAIRALAHPTLFPQTGVSLMTVCPTLTRTPLLNNMQTFLDLDTNFTKIACDLPGQEADVCGRNIVAAIEKGQNDSVWLLDMGNLELMDMKQYWTIPDVLHDTLKEQLNKDF